MLNLNQDDFISNYVTTFLATKAASAHPSTPQLDLHDPPIADAIYLARMAWYKILEYGSASLFTRSQSEPNALELGAAARKAGIVK